ncbi:MAG: hypothetical protein IPK82_33435 [Polyangiaceae bacterium]|nr:hypothetical protein [Polyangiaceae bacterium]
MTPAGSCEPLCQGGPCSAHLLAPLDGEVQALRVDATHVYWIEGQGKPNRIRRVPRDGGSAETLVADAKLAIDLVLVGDFVFWSEYVALSSPNTPGRIVRMSLDATDMQTLVDGLGSPTAITSDGSHVYWFEVSDGELARVPINGGPPEVLDGTLYKFSVGDMKVDDSFLYFSAGPWAGPSAGVAQYAKAGGEIGMFLDSLSEAGPIALDDTFVYAASVGDSIRRAPKLGGEQQAVVQDAGIGRALAVDANALYYFGSSGLHRLCKEGSSAPLVLAAGASGSRIAVDDAAVYFDDGGNLWRIDK